MGTLDEVRAARATLAGLALSGDPHVLAVVAADGPVDALTRLAGRHLPTDILRPLGHGVTGEQLRAHAAAVATKAARAGARVVIPEDDEWPTTLADLAAPRSGQASGGVLCLWVRGDPSLSATLHRAVAVVGARAATSYGTVVAGQLGYDLAAAGWTVVSTGAYGIEGAVLRGVLAGAGTPVAVLPAGVDRPYPAGHSDLFDRIANEGLLVSPWPPGTVPARERFMATGHLMAGMTGGTVLVEAGLRSNALRVLERAIDLGRSAMVVPGPVTSSLSAGAHQALRQHRQARLVGGAADVIAELIEPDETTQ